jgi:hypothetical protein
MHTDRESMAPPVFMDSGLRRNDGKAQIPLSPASASRFCASR